MGHEANQKMLDVESAGISEQLQDERGLPAASSSPTNSVTINWDASAPPEIVYTINDQSSLTEFISFTEFIEALRDTLANHPDREDIYDPHKDTNLSSSKKHPRLLAKPRGDQQQLSRWIEVKLQVTHHGKEATSSTTLVIRDDNVDVMGFSNHRGDWFEIGNDDRGMRMLPPRYSSKPLADWVVNKEQIANMLAESSPTLGKTFAADAVCVLSCFPDVAAGDKPKPRVALLGLMVMICYSARLDPVLEAIANGWDTGTRFTEQLMTTMGKYEMMSRGLWQWSRRNYSRPHPADSQLQAVCLVLNGPPEVVYTIRDEVSFLSFMIDLRRILADHPDREDILSKHDDRNLSSTHEHPLLPRQHAPYPERWIHIKLVAETSWTTLIMRDDNLYVSGFMNQQGVVYGLVDDHKDSALMLPDRYPNNNVSVTRLEGGLSVKYRSMLNAAGNDDVVTKLADARLGRDFAMKAVRVLSRYLPGLADDAGDNDPSPGLALAGLIFMFCESARMNPLHNAFARGWSSSTGFTNELMNLYVWKYGKKSTKLLKWKDKRYVCLPHPIEELQDIYLVLNISPHHNIKKKRKNIPPPGNPSPPPAGDNPRPPPPGNPPPSSSPSTPRPPTSSTTTREAAGNKTGGGGSSSSSVSASQPGNAGDAGAGTGTALQPDDDEGGHSSLSRSNSGSQSEDAYDDAQGHGRPLVELLAIHADLRVGTKVIVYDGIRGQIIYRKEQKEQGEQAMDELVLTGPYTCISASGCFAIQIDIPRGGLIDWEWDCYDPEYAEEVDKPPVTRTIGSSGPGRNVDVTYAVMSNALQATVEVMLWLEEGHGPSDVVVKGEITACIEDFHVGSVLFSRTQWAGHCFSHTADGSCFRLELARNVVAVPCGSKLHIRVKLSTRFSNTEAGKDLDVTLDFDNGTLARYHEVDGKKVVEVNISWYPETEMATAHQPEQFSEVVDEQKSVSALEPSRPAEAEAASTATAAVSERGEQRHKAKENLDVGATATVFGSTVLLGGVFLPKEAKQHPGNAVWLTVSLLLSFATFLSGKALVLLSLNMMGRQVLVSGGHRMAARCLVAACAVLSVLTLLSLLALLPGGVYLYIGLAVVTAVTLSAAGAHWFIRRMKGGGGVSDDDEGKDKEELDAASKTTCGIMNSAFGGLVGVLFSASKISGGVAAADSVESAAHAAIFFTFTTAMLGVFVMTVSKVVTNQRRPSSRQLLAVATAMKLANALLLCLLACAAFSAAFVVLRYRVFAAFAPLGFAAVLCFLLRHCIVVRHDRDGEEARIKAMEDIASKVTAATLGGIMSILGGALGEDDHDRWGSTGVLMAILTSAFVSGFGFMVLAAAPGSATAILAPVARVLVWSTVALFTATAVAVYGVEVFQG